MPRFETSRMLHPASVNVSGAGTKLGARLLAQLREGGFAGPVGSQDAMLAQADLAIIADDAADVPASLAAQAQLQAAGAIVVSDVADLGDLARRAGIRTLGPHSFGLQLPGIGLNASTLPLMPHAGKVALVAQSAALARTVIDWAVPNSVGFSQIIGIGGNADIGFGLVLDHLSRDPGTNAIMIEVDRVRNPRLFYSAARAAARLRPVVALAPGARLRDADGISWAAYEATFARAGVLLTGTFSEFLAAAETLTRVKPARGESLAILSNSRAAGRLAADFALEGGLQLAALSPESAQVLSLSLGSTPGPGPIYAGTAPTRLADLAALLSSAPEVGGILVVHAPSGGDDNAAIEALIACAKTVKIPLLIAAMGEQTGLPHRHLLAQAGLACFETPEAAISGFRHLIRNRRNRAAARELPASKVLQTAADAGAAQQVFMAARTAGQSALNRDQALALAAAYHIPVVAGGHAATPEAAATLACRIGFPVVVKLSHPDLPANRITGSIQFDLPDGPAVQRAAQLMFEGLSQRGAWLPGADFLVQHQAPRGTQLRILVADHEIFGPVIGFGPGGGDPDDFSALAIGLPPLNLPLAQALIERASVAPQLAAHRGAPAADLNAVAASLVRISQMIIDHTEILRLDLDPLFAYEAGVVAASAKITLRPPAATRPSLIISPYPSEWISHQTFGGEAFTLRPVRPEDADAHAALFARLSPEDVRYRFFSAIRRLPDEAVVRMTDVDYHREMAIIAKRDETGETAGVARLVRNDTDGLTAEFAVLVEAAAKGKGLASALMKAIIAWGAAQSVREINGQILADNQPMLTFIRRLGFTVERIVGESDIVEARLSL